MQSKTIKWIIFFILIFALGIDLIKKDTNEKEYINVLATKPKDINESLPLNRFIDIRDKQTYQKIEIDGREWMHTNLNYNIKGSVCYNYEPLCRENGQLYTWEAARRACPDGWRLPTKREWESLIKKHIDKGAFPIAGHVRIDGGVFKIPLGGYRHVDGDFIDLNGNGYYWSLDSHSTDEAYGYQFDKNNKLVSSYQREFNKDMQLSCRCIKKLEIPQPTPEL